MRSDFYYDSCGYGKIHACRWTGAGPAVGVVQIVHGIAEHVDRYTEFAEYLNSLGYVVVAEDHMGHGLSAGSEKELGYFHGGWFAAIEDTCRLIDLTKKDYPQLPYFLFGHSMGSFMTRSILARYPNLEIAGAVICGTGWLEPPILQGGLALCKLVCRKDGEKVPSPLVQQVAFGGYNKKVEHPKSEFDWLSRDRARVADYEQDPLCGFVVTPGLFRDMLTGVRFNQKQANLANMNRDLPVFFIAGGDDPVGNYGRGVEKSAKAFRQAGMKQVSVRIYPLCRHEILNEINRKEVYEDVAQWLAPLAMKA